MKKIVALGLSAALFLSSTSAFAFHRKPKAHLVYSLTGPGRAQANRDLIYIPLVTPLFDQVIIPF